MSSTILTRRLRRAIRELQEVMLVALDPVARQHVLRAADELAFAEKRAWALTRATKGPQ